MGHHRGKEPRQAGRKEGTRQESRAGGAGFDQLVCAFAALAHPLRAHLVALLCSAPLGGAYVCELVAHLNRAQSTVSHHLKVLVEAGIVKCEQRGTWAWYQVVPEKLAQLSEGLVALAATPVAFSGAT